MKKALLTAAALLLATISFSQPQILPGAESVDEYLPMLQGKRVSLLSNQTGILLP